MTLRRSALLFLSLTPFALAACGAATEEPGPSPDELDSTESGDELGSENFTYFIVTHPDYKKCMWPYCGGYYVKRVNRSLTQCADGSWQNECHMAELDLSALGVSPEEATKYENEVFGARHGLVRGKMAQVGNVRTLVASEAWVGMAITEPKGIFYRATDSGIVCITYPCPSLHEAKLNSNVERNIAGLDLAASGANEKQVEYGHQQLAEKHGVLVVGKHSKVSGPGGTGWQLNASEFYVPLVGKKLCATAYIAPPETLSPTFYAKNFSDEKEAWGWLDTAFPNGVDKQVLEGACDTPRACIEIYAPVCGVVKYSDPSTYSNDCFFEGAIMADAGSDGESKGYYTKGACEPVCDYSDPNKNYLGQSPEQCMTIKYFCQQGTVPFSDECGCGCETPQPEPCGGTTCAAGMVCCNASCGICTLPGQFCTQQACAPK